MKAGSVTQWSDRIVRRVVSLILIFSDYVVYAEKVD